MICQVCNLEVPIVVQALMQGQQKDTHSHLNVCIGCLMFTHNKWVQSQQQQQQRGIKK